MFFSVCEGILIIIEGGEEIFSLRIGFLRIGGFWRLRRLRQVLDGDFRLYRFGRFGRLGFGDRCRAFTGSIVSALFGWYVLRGQPVQGVQATSRLLASSVCSQALGGSNSSPPGLC